MKLISSPAKAWEEISMEEDRRKVFTAFVYPMIGLCGLSVFIGSLIALGWSGPQSFQYAMTKCCAVAVALFGGYFQAAVRFCAMGDNLSLVQQFSGYAMVAVFLLRMVLGILPDFQIIAMLLQFYTVYVAWEGSARLLQVSDANRLRFTLTASVLLIVCPMLIEWIFNRLTIMLN